MGTVSDGLRQDHDDMRTVMAVLMEMANRMDAGEEPFAPGRLRVT